MLEHLGFAVERVSAAEEALARFDDGFEPDLVLSDIMMPGGMNGVELARELKRRRPELPVLLTSGYAAAVRDFKASEDLPILQKPYSLEALEQALESNGALQD
jgi:CheY-like chemotaxis protein